MKWDGWHSGQQTEMATQLSSSYGEKGGLMWSKLPVSATRLLSSADSSHPRVRQGKRTVIPKQPLETDPVAAESNPVPRWGDPYGPLSPWAWALQSPLRESDWLSRCCPCYHWEPLRLENWGMAFHRSSKESYAKDPGCSQGSESGIRSHMLVGS